MVELEFTRTYQAPQQEVWNAWTDPTQLALWWGPRGITTPRDSIELDLRPGGKIRMDMVDDNTGARYPNTGTYLEVDPPSRLVWSDDGFPDGTGKAMTTVTFTEIDEATTAVHVHIAADFTDTIRGDAEKGWESQLDRLTEILADIARGPGLAQRRHPKPYAD